MKNADVLLAGLIFVVSVVSPAVGDYYDNFSDGFWERTPNDPRYDANDPYWTDPNNSVFRDVDNPDWTIYNVLAANPLAQIISDSVADNALRMACDRIFVYPIGAMAAGVVTTDRDPNTSPTWQDDTTDHYALVWVYYPGYYNPHDANPKKRASFNDPNYDPNYDDPNADRGRAMILMHADESVWTGLVFQLDFDAQARVGEEFPHSYHAILQSFDFSNISSPSAMFRRVWIEPNDPHWGSYPNLPYGYTGGCPHMLPANQSYNPYNGPDFGGANIDNWERSGFWMLMQFEHDPNHAPGDPNGKFLRGAMWHGDKYDWDGKFMMEGELSSPGLSGWGSQWYWPAGGVFVLASSDEWTNYFPADVAYDNVEVRTGRFSKDPRRLVLTLSHANWGTVTVDPDLRDPNDPNTPANRLFRYTNGTEIVLSAEPIGGKTFKEWTVYDPNYPGDISHAVTDSNTVLYLTMNADWVVAADFKCGSGIPPFIAFALCALGLGLIVRRRS
jgi:hypothetical protein